MKKSKINECLRKRLLFSQEPVYIRTFWSKKEKSERIIEWKRFHAQVRKIVNTFARLPKKYQSFARLPVCPNFKIFSFALLCFSWKRENVFIHFHDFHLLDHPCSRPFFSFRDGNRVGLLNFNYDNYNSNYKSPLCRPCGCIEMHCKNW